MQVRRLCLLRFLSNNATVQNSERMSNTTSETVTLQGWESSPSGRGTIDVIHSCLITIFLCTWSVLCINIAPPGEGTVPAILQKCKIAVLCVLGPDFLLYLVVGQWQSACRSYRQFHDEGYISWTMKHAFFADMGGFTLRTSDGVSWPLDANQLSHMIKRGFISESTVRDNILVSESDIDDRNKQNALVRVFTVGQILWFLASCIGRAAQRLAITTLELTTIGFVATTIGVSIFWFHKPADILTPHSLVVDVAVADIHADAGLNSSYIWYDTPLDFLNSERSYFEVLWRYALTSLRGMLFLRKGQTRPITRRSDDTFPAVSHRGMLIVGVAGIVSWGINFVAWNFQFPSSMECYMWRVSSIVLISIIAIGELYQEILLTFFPKLKQQACVRFAEVRLTDMNHGKNKSPGEKLSNRLSRSWKRFTQWLPNNSPDHNPEMTMPTVVLLPALFGATLYTLARAYILVEDLISLRAQPPSVYESVNWSNFLPHF